MKSSVIASYFLFVASVLAAPTATQQLTARNATEVTQHLSSPTQTVFPSLQVRWKSKEPGKLAKNDRIGHLLTTPSEEVHTAVYFNLPQEAYGKTCKLVFRQSINDGVVNIADSSAPAMFDIYRLNGCLNEGYSFNTSLPRGVKAGILTAHKGGLADWQSVDMRGDYTYPKMGAAPTFSCQAGGEYSFEMIAHSGVNLGWLDSY
ncbi:uncharacterized protein K441DRAFT_677232 [Cenococcum geophilum 1.58]|uniref:uncharacterized protein n=1 Tax=Cenococcum geophilum 1.58 TaxID=794803 RepID=UPI00358FDA3E|nr:hypothetical protein K441DRAFT_677232 [Cenococcum geophilum 1.58]